MCVCLGRGGGGGGRGAETYLIVARFMTRFENSYCTSGVSLHSSRVGNCRYRVSKSRVHIGSTLCLGCIG